MHPERGSVGIVRAEKRRSGWGTPMRPQTICGAWRVRGWRAVVGLFLAISPALMRAADDSTPVLLEGESLSLKELTQRVILHNTALQSKQLEFRISRKRYQAEKGIFEPDFVASYERDENKRRNTAEQQSQQFLLNTTRIFQEQNNVYNAGLEGLIPIGGRVRLGYTMRDLDNNLQPSLGVKSEFQTFAGISLTQPLLKNFGTSVTLANLRLAALASDAAFHDYRRQLMLTLSTAEASYWNLYLAQEQVRFFEESVKLAETILKDAQARFAAGRSSELETQEAQSALALRRSKLADAEQKRFEASSKLSSLFGSAAFGSNEVLVVSEVPGNEAAPAFSFQESALRAFKSNPDYWSQRKKMDSEDIRLAFAKNQRLPQVDLKASYGLNGLAETVSLSLDQVSRGSYASWSAGFEMRMPVLGGTKSRREYEAAQLRVQQALTDLKELETQIFNGLDNAHRKILSSRRSVDNYRQVVEFNQSLLKSQIARLEAGKVEPRKVLEVEADLLEARSAASESLVQYRRALLELELVEGSFLESRNLEVDKKALDAETRSYIPSEPPPVPARNP
jgi:outer membrane protein TolC